MVFGLRMATLKVFLKAKHGHFRRFQARRSGQEKKTALTTPSGQPAADAEQKLRADVARRCKAQGLEEAGEVVFFADVSGFCLGFHAFSSFFPVFFMVFQCFSLKCHVLSVLSLDFKGFSYVFYWFSFMFAGFRPFIEPH